MAFYFRSLVRIFLAIVLSVALPAHASTATLEADGSTTYFFAYPSLRIESSTALDLSGLQRIEAVADGMLVRGAFELLAADVDAASLLGPDGALWTGHSNAIGHLDIFADRNLNLGMAALAGFQYITLSSGSSLVFNGSMDMADGENILSTDGSVVERVVFTAPEIKLGPAQDIRLPPPSQLTLAVPEPGSLTLLVAGLIVLGATTWRQQSGASSTD